MRGVGRVGRAVVLGFHSAVVADVEVAGIVFPLSPRAEVAHFRVAFHAIHLSPFLFVGVVVAVQVFPLLDTERNDALLSTLQALNGRLRLVIAQEGFHEAMFAPVEALGANELPAFHALPPYANQHTANPVEPHS